MESRSIDEVLKLETLFLYYFFHYIALRLRHFLAEKSHFSIFGHENAIFFENQTFLTIMRFWWNFYWNFKVISAEPIFINVTPTQKNFWVVLKNYVKTGNFRNDHEILTSNETWIFWAKISSHQFCVIWRIQRFLASKIPEIFASYVPFLELPPPIWC